MATCSKCYNFIQGSQCCSEYNCDHNEYPMSKYYRGGAEDCPRFDSVDNHGGVHGGCFLTSACVEHMGKADNCEELTTLRAFRDGWMKKSEEGKALVEEYYQIAPAIVSKIEASKDKGCHYCYIYSVVQKCISLIKEGKNQETMDEYKAMVLNLQKQFA